MTCQNSGFNLCRTLKPKQSPPRSSLASTIGWIGELRRVTTSLHDLASSAALLTNGSLPLESFHSIMDNNKLVLGQELLVAETKQLETLRGLGFLQGGLPRQQLVRNDATPPISLHDLTLDALARHAIELQQELLSFLLQVLQQASLHQLQGDGRLQGDLLQLNRIIRTLAIHCDLVSGMDRPADTYFPSPISTSPIVMLQMTKIAATMVRCVRQSYEPRVWKGFFGTPASLQFSVLRDDKEEPDKAEIEKLKREVERLKKKEEWNEKEIEGLKREVGRLSKGIEDSRHKTEAPEQLERILKDDADSCLTAEKLAPIAKIKPQSISARVKELADLKWLYPSKKGKKRCFTFREARVILNNPSYENPGPRIT